MQAEPGAEKPGHPGMLQHPDLKNLYRPDNVLHFLAHQPDLDAYLSSIGTDALCTRDAKLIARSQAFGSIRRTTLYTGRPGLESRQAAASGEVVGRAVGRPLGPAQPDVANTPCRVGEMRLGPSAVPPSLGEVAAGYGGKAKGIRSSFRVEARVSLVKRKTLGKDEQQER